MARQAEKSLVKSNAAKIGFLRRAALGINALFILVRLVWCYKSTSKKTWFLYIMTNIVASMIQFNLEKLATPRYAADGSLKSAGEDLGQAGVTEYLTDIVYMTWIIYFCVAFITDYAWLFFFAIPIYAGFKAWPMLKPMIAQARSQLQATQTGRRPVRGEGNGNAVTESEMSKRQAKLKARQEKFGGVRMRA